VVAYGSIVVNVTWIAIVDHLLPTFSCARQRAASSAAVHGERLIPGSRKFFHRSRHCFAVRPDTATATSGLAKHKAQHINELVLLCMCASAQNMPPHHGMCSRLHVSKRASSSTDQAPFFNPGLSVSDHLWEHCVWLRSGIVMAIAFQSFQNILVLRKYY
jgi:hypothetical protein